MKTILIIEDDKVIRDNTKELLEYYNYKVVTAANEKEGVQIAFDLIPDLVLCDLIMHVVNGYLVLEQLAKNKETVNIPFIFFSTKNDKRDIRKGMSLGADDYITKPFSEEDLLSVIKSRLAKYEILKKNYTRGSSSSPHQQSSTLLELKSLYKVKREKGGF